VLAAGALIVLALPFKTTVGADAVDMAVAEGAASVNADAARGRGIAGEGQKIPVVAGEAA